MVAPLRRKCVQRCGIVADVTLSYRFIQSDYRTAYTVPPAVKYCWTFAED